MTKFDKWFKEQFGALPMSDKDRIDIENLSEAAASRVRVLQATLDNNEILTREYRAARYARTAFEEKKK